MKKISPYSFWGRLFQNWRIKLLSFVLAIIVYVLCFYSINTNKTVNVPLNVIMPEGFKAVSNVKDSATIYISGSDEAIYLVDPARVKVSVDFSDVSENGIYTAPVVLSYDNGVMKDNVINISVKPLSLRVKFEKE